MAKVRPGTTTIVDIPTGTQETFCDRDGRRFQKGTDGMVR